MQVTNPIRPSSVAITLWLTVVPSDEVVLCPDEHLLADGRDHSAGAVDSDKLWP
ncbi:MAG: hypothetical protein KatS3mg061_2925 [Dehalococcoidia bacterium]|nr:MAG: hypothetical protein KatS3mg061_2925 [Dehalococcoidia bacterium]